MPTAKPQGEENESSRLNILQRIHAISRALGSVEHDQKTPKAAGGFSFTSYEAIISALRPHLDEYGVVYWIEEATISRENNRVTIAGKVCIACVDNPEDRIVNASFGEGCNNRDLGPNTAYTYLLKNALRHLFRVQSSTIDENSSDDYVPQSEAEQDEIDRVECTLWLNRLRDKSELPHAAYATLMQKRYKKSTRDMTIGEMRSVIRQEATNSEFQRALDWLDAVDHAEAREQSNQTAKA